MPRIDAMNEAIIVGQPMEVYKALLNEVSGVTNWWMPYMAFKLKGDIPIDHEGAVYEATISPTSRMNAKFSAKMTKIVEGKLIEEEVAGSFIGTASWTFEPKDGKTKAAVSRSGAMRLSAAARSRLVARATAEQCSRSTPPARPQGRCRRMFPLPLLRQQEHQVLESCSDSTNPHQ